MKFLVLLLVLVGVLWLARALRRRPPPSAPPAPPRAGAEAPEDMVACAHCGVHLPRSEALPGRGGLFCGPAHRAAYEQAHP